MGRRGRDRELEWGGHGIVAAGGEVVAAAGGMCSHTFMCGEKKSWGHRVSEQSQSQARLQSPGFQPWENKAS